MTDIKLLILYFIVGSFTFIVNALEIFGFYAATRYGEVIDSISDEVTYDPDDREILWWVNYYGKQMIGEFWMKPISNCPICMSSYHSFLIWIPIYIAMPFSFFLLYVHAIYILCLAGFNKIIVSMKGIDL